MSGWFRRVLYVVLDPAAPTARLADAAAIAGWFDATLTVQSVMPSVTGRHRRLGLDKRSVERWSERSLRSWVTDQLADGAPSSAKAPSIHVDDGRLPVEVVARVMRDRHDLVIVAPGASSDKLATVRRLARVCPCPMLVLRRPIGGGDALVAVDPDDRLDLNIMLLSVARDWSQAVDGSVDLVHAYDTVVGTLDAGPFAPDDGAVFAERLADAHREAVDELIERVGANWVRERRVVAGRPSEVIIDTARSTDANLVLVGTAGRRMAAILIGNTADRVLAHTDASVMIVKPPGFVPQLDADISLADETVEAGCA